jgi:hypothetical protein
MPRVVRFLFSRRLLLIDRNTNLEYTVEIIDVLQNLERYLWRIDSDIVNISGSMTDGSHHGKEIKKNYISKIIFQVPQNSIQQKY